LRKTLPINQFVSARNIGLKPTTITLVLPTRVM